MRGVLAILVAAVLVVSVSSLAWQRRAVERKILDDADESDRYVDMGVLLSVVEMDLKAGFELEPGKPPVKIVRQHRLGGMLDTWTRKIVGPSARPRYWQCSTQQEPLILHDAAQPVWTTKPLMMPAWPAAHAVHRDGRSLNLAACAAG